MKDILEGTIVRAKPFGYDEQTGDYAVWDVPDYDAAGVGPIVEGPLSKRRSSDGDMVCFIAGIAVEPESIEIVGNQEGSEIEGERH